MPNEQVAPKSPEALPKIEPSAKAEPVATKTVSDKEILELLAKVNQLEKKVATKVEAPAPQADTPIDWTKITEQQVADLSFPIPVIEHEIPEYMTVYLRDQNYIAKWSHTSQRRLGMLLAEGYDYVKKEDWDENYPHILEFNAEGKLIYDDVVALKIHKSKYFGKVRRETLKATQLKNVAGYSKVKGTINNSISNISGMESAVKRGAMTFYDESVESATEVHM